jgi:NAD(P)-dependent dehydrogenase (short-subunit alcohol dehydrogenase family)
MHFFEKSCDFLSDGAHFWSMTRRNSVFLASDDSRYMTGRVLHPNGGRVVNG